MERQLEFDFDCDNRVNIGGISFVLDRRNDFIGFYSLAFGYPLLVNMEGKVCYESYIKFKKETLNNKK